MNEAKKEQIRKFLRIDDQLRMAVAVVFREEESHPPLELIPGVCEIRKPQEEFATLYPTQKFLKFYLAPEIARIDKPEINEKHPRQILIPIPQDLQKASRAELLFNNNKAGAFVRFGRHGEIKPFGFSAQKRYIKLSLFPKDRLPTPSWEFNPLFVRVDRGEERYYFCVLTVWVDNMIGIKIIRDPDPQTIPQHLQEA